MTMDPAGPDNSQRPEPPGPGEPASTRPAARLLVTMGLLVVVLGLGFIALLVTGNGDDDAVDESPTAGRREAPTGSSDGVTTTTSRPRQGQQAADAGPNDESERIVATIAGAIGQDYDGVVTDDQAECIARAMVEVFGITRGSDLTEVADAELRSALRGCIDPETAARLNLD